MCGHLKTHNPTADRWLFRSTKKQKKKKKWKQIIINKHNMCEKWRRKSKSRRPETYGVPMACIGKYSYESSRTKCSAIDLYYVFNIIGVLIFPFFFSVDFRVCLRRAQNRFVDERDRESVWCRVKNFYRKSPDSWRTAMCIFAIILYK